MQIYIYMKFQLPGRSYVYKVQIYIHECQLPKRAWNCGVSEACRTAVTWKEDCQTESEIICIKIIILNLNSATWENVKMVIFSKYVQVLSLALSFYFKYNIYNLTFVIYLSREGLSQHLAFHQNTISAFLVIFIEE